MSLTLKDFDFSFPNELTAQAPLADRAASKMLVLKSDGTKLHEHFKNLPNYLEPNDLVVVNNTSVLACRLFARKPSGGKLEVFLLQPFEDSSKEEPLEWRTLLSPTRGLKLGMKLQVFSRQAETLSPHFIEVTSLEEGHYRVRFESQAAVTQTLSDYGEMPLPPYIKRQANHSPDRERYQTVFAQKPGAVAAPTAGLHFTPPIKQELLNKGVAWAEVTLHVGLGTFEPVRTEQITQHQMHAERYEIPQATIESIEKCRKQKGRILAVGSTVLRTLETYALTHKLQGETNLFIQPGFEFKLVDLLLTNFHRPQSTLLILVAAFVGRERILNAYQEAIEKNYRLFSYGDCTLLERAN